MSRRVSDNEIEHIIYCYHGSIRKMARELKQWRRLNAGIEPTVEFDPEAQD